MRHSPSLMLILILLGIVGGVGPSHGAGLSDASKSRIRDHIRRTFQLDKTSEYVVVTLKDGKTMIAKSAEVIDGSYHFQVARNKKRSIFSLKVIPKKEVKSVTPEGGGQGLWAEIQKLSLPWEAVEGYYHEQIIALVLDPFLDTQRDSPHHSATVALRKDWAAEQRKLDAGYKKIEGKWYAPGDPLPKRLPLVTRRALQSVRTFMRQGQPFDAVEICKNIRIPMDFPEIKRNFKTLVASLLTQLAGHAQSESVRINAERTKARNIYNRDVATVRAWQPRQVRVVKTSRESSYGASIRRSAKESDARLELKARQDAAMARHRQRYDAAVAKCDAKLVNIDTRVEQYAILLRPLAHIISTPSSGIRTPGWNRY